jgi:predicted DCC family thiol-disulfide oxidoreductase YuxK
VRRLTVLYDASCGFCRRCRQWLLAQPKLLELEFVAGRSEEAARRFPQLASETVVDELVVVSDEGGVYSGARAWIMCLYALTDYREWSVRLARPRLLPFARRAFEAISRNRRRLSRLLRLASDEEVVSSLTRVRKTSSPSPASSCRSRGPA